MKEHLTLMLLLFALVIWRFPNELQEAKRFIFQHDPIARSPGNPVESDFPELLAKATDLSLPLSLGESQAAVEFLSEDTVVAVVSTRAAQVKSCLGRIEKRAPASNRFEVSLRIQGRTGRVLKVDVPGTKAKDPVRSCVVFYIKSLSFPRFLAREQTIRVPVEFP